jgi:hypothetical protein
MCKRCLKSKAKADARGQGEATNLNVPTPLQSQEKHHTTKKLGDASDTGTREGAPVTRSVADATSATTDSEEGAKDSRLKSPSKVGRMHSTKASASGSQSIRLAAPAGRYRQEPVLASKVIDLSPSPAHRMPPERNYSTSCAQDAVSGVADPGSSRSPATQSKQTSHPPHEHPIPSSSSGPHRSTIPETTATSTQQPFVDLTTPSPPKPSLHNDGSLPHNNNARTGTGPSPPRLKRGFRKTTLSHKTQSSPEKISAVMTPNNIRTHVIWVSFLSLNIS